MTRWELETFRARERSAVLTIACPPEVAARCHSAAALVGSIVKEAGSIGEAVTIATQVRPLVLVMPEELYARYSADFEALATEVEATVVRLSSSELSQADIEKLLFDAVVSAVKRRAPDEIG